MFDKIKDKYNPQEFEQKNYSFWFENKYFYGHIDKQKSSFCIVIPPPNITGYLHMGHALVNTLQDVVIRYWRMKQFATTWIPGTDHAGIATQNVVEKELNRKGVNRFELGRGKFVEKVWEWKKEYGSRIIRQLKSLGCSCDWDRIRFTLDKDYTRAVIKEFVILYNNGLIHKGNYMVNWCPRCLTAISDIEVEHRDEEASLWDIKYPLIDERTGKPSSSDCIIVSTTRPETMLGDTAVAINPKDKRYRKYINRFILLPLTNRKIPIIEDDFVDMEFGTGAVKVTPAHDPNDFDIGRRHNLEEINIMDDCAVLNSNAGKYKGMDRYRAREKVVEDLKKQGYLISISDHISSVGYCSRCETVVEPRISMQWFVSMSKLVKPAINAVKEGKVKIIPKKWEKIYFNWMENIKDWCISRQLWWGHRIPVWYCRDCGEMIVSESEPSRCESCKSKNLEQDSDVLDTWFSSCLWPFASMGWPDKTPELDYFFPTSTLITGHDIIFFWVARMIMMSLYFTKDIPFRRVFINPLVTDSSGQKMSKSKGNVVDPMGIINKNGADVLRFTLTSLTTPGRNLLLGKEKIEGVRNFANKLWNASKFVIASIADADNIKNIGPNSLNLNIWDRWILTRSLKVLRAVEKYLQKYNFSYASRLLQNFFWSDYCDWYIESVKVRIYSSEDAGDRKTAQYILWDILEKYLRMLHPFMPFVTEQIWQNIPHEGESIMIQKFPEFSNKLLDRNAEKDIAILFDVISEIRKIRSELNINPSEKIKVNLVSANSKDEEILEQNKKYICSLAKVGNLEFSHSEEKKGYIKTTKGNASIYIYILDIVDINLEIKRILDEAGKIKKDIEKSGKKISNPQFLEKAPSEIIQKEKDKFYKFGKTLKVLNEQLKRMDNIKK